MNKKIALCSLFNVAFCTAYIEKECDCRPRPTLQQTLDSTKLIVQRVQKIELSRACSPTQLKALEISIAHFKKFVHRRAEIDASKKFGHTNAPLHIFIFKPIPVASASLYKLVHWLVKNRKANINALGANDLTPLSIACARANRSLVILFLINGADPRVGQNPLIAALEAGSADAMFPFFQKIICGPEA